MITATLKPTPTDVDAPLGGFDSVLDEIKAKAELDYRELVIALADGQHASPQDIRDAKLSADRTNDDFRRHYELALERRQAVADMEKARELTATLPAITSECIAQVAEIKRLDLEHAERMAPQRSRVSSVSKQIDATTIEASQLDRAARNVLNGSQSPESQAKFRSLSDKACRLRGRLQEMNLRRDRLLKSMADAESAVGAERAKLARWVAGPASQIADDGIQRAKSSILAAETELHECSQRMGELVNLEGQVAEAEAALARWNVEEFTDWRQMQFD